MPPVIANRKVDGFFAGRVSEPTVRVHGSVHRHGGGDGAPAGEYKVTLEWLTYQAMGNVWVGPNKLAGPDGSAKTTTLTASVAADPVVLPTFEVKAKPNADSLKPEKSALLKKKRGP